MVLLDDHIKVLGKGESFVCTCCKAIVSDNPDEHMEYYDVYGDKYCMDCEGMAEFHKRLEEFTQRHNESHKPKQPKQESLDEYYRKNTV